MKRIIYILFAISLCHNFTLGQWILQHSGVPSLYDVQFINLHTGWACGVNSTILKTTNGGSNWFIQQSNLSSNKNLHGPSMLDSNVGFLVGWYETILKTTNGGSNWLVLSDGPVGQGNSWNSSCFINAQTGWICGFLGVVKRTTNGGATWDSLNATGTLRDIQFINPLTGWVAGDGGYIRKTTNSGNSWLMQFQGTNADYLNNSLHFINVNTGWIIGHRTYVFRTTNSGIDWDTLAALNGEAIRFANTLTGWCGGSLAGNNASLMYKTTDGGFNWAQQSIPVTSGFCGSIYVYNDSVAWGTFGDKIINTTNGGTYVSISNIGNQIPEIFKLYQNYPNPYNSQTNIEFDITLYDNYSLIIYDILGRKVETVLNQYFQPGKFKVNLDADKLSSGIYFYSLSSNKHIQFRKMTLIK